MDGDGARWLTMELTREGWDMAMIRVEKGRENRKRTGIRRRKVTGEIEEMREKGDCLPSPADFTHGV
jgi:hypothetical protein